MQCDGPYSLIARITGTPFALAICRKEVFDGTYDVLHPPAPGQLPVVIDTQPIPSAFPHFPYGFPVIAD
jgi:hypothetical protein